jgi:hypothetical protein
MGEAETKSKLNSSLKNTVKFKGDASETSESQ